MFRPFQPSSFRCRRYRAAQQMHLLLKLLLRLMALLPASAIRRPENKDTHTEVLSYICLYNNCQVASEKQHTILQPEKNAVLRNSSEKRHLFIFHQVLSILLQAVIQSKSAFPDSSFTVVSAGTNTHCPFWNASVSPVSAVIVPLPEIQSSTANAFVVETAAASAGVAACKCNQDT